MKKKMFKSSVSLCLVVVLLLTLSFSSVAAGPPEHVGSPEHSNAPEHAGPPEHAQPSSEDINHHVEMGKELHDFIEENTAKYEDKDNSTKRKYAIKFLNKKIDSGEVKNIQKIDEAKIEQIDDDVKLDSRIIEGINKAIVRAEFWVAANLAAPLLPHASYFLEHSLDDDPDDVYIWDPFHSIMDDIRATNVYQNNIQEFESNIPTDEIIYSEEFPARFTRHDCWDLFLALHRTDMYSEADKRNGWWGAMSTFEDTYDFQPSNWEEYDGLPGTVVNIINDYGYYAQEIGAIQNYDIQIDVRDELEP